MKLNDNIENEVLDGDDITDDIIEISVNEDGIS